MFEQSQPEIFPENAPGNFTWDEQMGVGDDLVQLFSALKRMIAVRKKTGLFADFNNRELIEVENPLLFSPDSSQR